MAQKPNASPHRKWFQEQCKRNHLTQNSVAKALKVHPAAISRLFRGGRQLKLEESTRLASMFGVPLEEVIFRFGGTQLPPSHFMKSGGPHVKGQNGRPLHRIRENVVEVTGWLDGELIVHPGLPGKAKAIVPCPLPSSDHIRALLCHTAGSRYDEVDGALLFYEHTEKKGAPSVHPEARGRPCVVRVRGEDRDRVATPRRGLEPGTYNLTAIFTPTVILESVHLESASPILWTKL